MKTDLGKYYTQCRNIRKSEKIYVGQMQIIHMANFFIRKIQNTILLFFNKVILTNMSLNLQFNAK